MAVLVGIVVLVLAAQNIPLTRHLRRVERDRLITALERDAFTLAGRSATALDRDRAGDDPAISRMVAEYRGSSDARVVVTDEAGTAVVSSDEESIAGREYATRSEIATSLRGEPVSGERHSPASRRRGTDRRRPAPNGRYAHDTRSRGRRCSQPSDSQTQLIVRFRNPARLPARQQDAGPDRVRAGP